MSKFTDDDLEVKGWKEGSSDRKEHKDYRWNLANSETFIKNVAPKIYTLWPEYPGIVVKIADSEHLTKALLGIHFYFPQTAFYGTKGHNIFLHDDISEVSKSREAIFNEYVGYSKIIKEKILNAKVISDSSLSWIYYPKGTWDLQEKMKNQDPIKSQGETYERLKGKHPRLM